MADKYPLVIVGGGSAGFAAATRANDIGLKAAVINDGLLGGTCVNVGCIPSKYLLEVSRQLSQAKQPVYDGISTSEVEFSFRKTMDEKDRIVNSLRESNYVKVMNNLQHVTLIEGKATLLGDKIIETGGTTIEADKIILAIGAKPYLPAFEGIDKVDYLTSSDMLRLEELPKALIVIGGRAVGLELGQAFHRFGSRVTVLQRSEKILPEQEPEVSEMLKGYLVDEGIDVRTGVSIGRLYQEDDIRYIEADIKGETETFNASHILVATGRKPVTDGLGLENEGIRVKDGFIDVNDYLQTANPDIYAAGDCVSRIQLETLAAKMGNVAVRNAFDGNEMTIEVRDYPRAVFTDPQAAMVGYTEEEYKRKMGYCSCRSVKMEYVPKAQVIKDVRGMVKVGIDYKSRKLVGGQILAVNAAELIHELTLAIQYGHTLDDIIGTAHVFPTLSEGIKRANQAFYRDVTTMSCCIE